MREMAEMALAFFYQLQAPGAGEDGLDPGEVARRMVAQAKEIFGIGTTAAFPPPSNVTPGSSQVEEDQRDAEAAEA